VGDEDEAWPAEYSVREIFTKLPAKGNIAGALMFTGVLILI